MKMTLKLLMLTLVSVAGLSTSAYAGSITKTFEFGAGTANANSNKRTFSVPCGLAVSAAVKFSRKGDAGAANDVPVVIELRSPGETPDAEGPVEATEEASATRTAQTVNLNGSESRRGCALPWIVRVKPKTGSSAAAISGHITVTFNDSVKNLTVQDAGSINLNSANSVTVNIGGSGGITQGVVSVTGVWYHNLTAMFFPIQMKFELLDPNGNVMASDSGVSSTSMAAGDYKLKITYMMPELKRGQWKLRIKNISDGHDAVRVKPIATLKPDCPN